METETSEYLVVVSVSRLVCATWKGQALQEETRWALWIASPDSQHWGHPQPARCDPCWSDEIRKVRQNQHAKKFTVNPEPKSFPLEGRETVNR